MQFSPLSVNKVKVILEHSRQLDSVVVEQPQKSIESCNENATLHVAISVETLKKCGALNAMFNGNSKY